MLNEQTWLRVELSSDFLTADLSLVLLGQSLPLRGTYRRNHSTFPAIDRMGLQVTPLLTPV